MATLNILAGVPGSGKSSWAKLNKTNNSVIISSDEIRSILFGSASWQSNPKMVFAYMYDAAMRSLEYGQDVIFDCTSLSKDNRKITIDTLKDHASEINCIYLKIDLQLCIKQNSLRNRVVPEHIIEKMYNSFEEPSIDEGYDNIIIVESLQEPVDS